MMSMHNKTILLIDGSYYLYRAYYALPKLKNKKGKPTGAIFGFINMLKNLPKKYNTNKIVIIFDSLVKNFRKTLYPLYKANRKSIEKELSLQILPLFKILKKLGYPLISIKGVEADDVIGSIAKQFCLKHYSIRIFSGDKDFYQLINSKITVIDPMKKKLFDINQVIKKFGIAPNAIVDYLALVGDRSDNIPGIKKVGPKTAIKLLKQYNDIKGIITNIDEINGIIGQNLKNQINDLMLYKTLVTIKCDLNISYNIMDLTLSSYDLNYIKMKFKEYEFFLFLKELDNFNYMQEYTNKENKINFTIITDINTFNIFYKKLEQLTSYLVLYLIFNRKNIFDSTIIGISFLIIQETYKEYFYLPFIYDTEDESTIKLDFNLILSKIKFILENNKIKKIIHNNKMNYHILANIGINMQGIKFDTMLEAYLLNNNFQQYNLDSLSHFYLKYDLILLPIDQLNKLFKIASFACECVHIVYKLHKKLWKLINNDDYIKQHYLEEELPVSFVITNMERTGIKINKKEINILNNILDKKINELKVNCFKYAGKKFNLSSRKELNKILFTEMKFPILKKTSTGEASTSEEVLKLLSTSYHKNDLPNTIIQYRHLKSLKINYTEKLPKMINMKTGRVHTNYEQVITLTGRLSSSSPNLQNIPIKSELGKNIRKSFIVKKGYKIVTADYSQIELRILAHVSQDNNLINSFNNNIDIHKYTAAEILGIDENNVTYEQRSQAKTINFGIIYGMSHYSLAKKLHISSEQAKEYIEMYFLRYPNVKKYIENIQHFAIANGYVKTIFNRKIYISDIYSINRLKKNYALRQAINIPMQGSVSNIIKRAMIDIYQWMMLKKNTVKLILQIHDELVFEIKTEEVKKCSNNIKKIMESIINLNVPLVVNIKNGNNLDNIY